MECSACVWRRYRKKANSAASATMAVPMRASCSERSDLLLALVQGDVADLHQLARRRADGVHLLAAHVGGDDELPGVFLAVLAQPHAHVHLGHLAQHVLRQLGQLGEFGEAGRRTAGEGSRAGRRPA